VSAAFASLPAGVGAAIAPLLGLWGLTSFGHTIVFHFIHGGGLLIEDDCNLLVCGGFALAVLVLKLMAQGAIYRVAVFGKDARKEGLGPLGLQFGAPELRLLGTGILIGLFFLVVALAVFIVFAVAFNSSGLAGHEHNTLKALFAVFGRHEGADWIFILYVIAAWIFLFFLAVRFSLAPVATIAQKKIVALNALGLSSGNVAKLFFGMVLFALPLMLVSIFVFHHVMPGLTRAGTVSPRLIVHAVLQAIAIFAIFPLLAGFLSSAYKQISESRAH
jgi:hypothetical protein